MLNVFQSGLDGLGNPTLSLVAMAPDAFGFGSSAPVVTSNGTTDGTALVWVVWMPDGSGQNAQLRAYDAVPTGGALSLRWSTPIGTASKFNPPGIGSGRVYVGTRDGNVYGFGAPVDQPLTTTPLNLGTVDIGKSNSGQVVFTATRATTVTSVVSTNAEFSTGTPSPAFPASLAQGATLTIPVTFTPSQVGIRSTAIVVQADGAPVSAPVTGIGRRPSPALQIAPPVISFGGAAVNKQISGTLTISNVGGAPLIINSVTSPKAPFSATGAPAPGSSLAPGQSVTVTFTFSPTQVGSFSDQVSVNTSAGNKQVPLTGTAALAGNLVLNPTTLDFGDVPVGQNKVLSFQVTNTGGSRVTVTKSKPPGLAVGFTNTDDLQEGATIDAGQTQTLHVQFAPTKAGAVADHWVINADGNQGVLTLPLSGTGGSADAGGGGGGGLTKGCSSPGGGVALGPLLMLLPWLLRRRRTTG